MKRILPILVSLGFLVVVYAMLDMAAVLRALKQTNLAWLAASLAVLIAMVLLSVYRLVLTARAGQFHLSGRDALEAVFVGNALNLVLPGKLGDLLKAVLMSGGTRAALPGAICLGVWEKLADLALLFLLAGVPLAFLRGDIVAFPLITIGVIGIAALVFPAILRGPLSWFARLAPLGDAWATTLVRVRARPVALGRILGLTALIWAGHLLQIAMMAYALGIRGDAGDWTRLAGMIPFAILAGLAPLTLAGVGTRDAALLLLLAPSIGPEPAAALGVLFWLRYLVPGILGSPLVPKFLSTARQFAKAEIQ